MKFDSKIEELLQQGSEFDFDHNSKWNENGQFCEPSVGLLAWIAEVQQFVADNYGNNSAPARLIARFDADEDFTYASSEEEFNQHIGYLKAALTACKKIRPKGNPEVGSDNAVEFVNTVFRGFHKAVLRLQKRHGKRNAFEITDEYDVQDLMAALLRLKFEDVRDEECSPSCAGGSTRIDFLLKNEQIGIEIKMTRDGLSDKEIGCQLTEDVKRYQAHPDCRRLMCFVYDRDCRIQNPSALIADLSQHGDFPVAVYISPTR